MKKSKKLVSQQRQLAAAAEEAAEEAAEKLARKAVKAARKVAAEERKEAKKIIPRKEDVSQLADQLFSSSL
jgi:vacuolar-type H+-ATPase subunit H